MEATYRRVMIGKRREKDKRRGEKGEKRNLIQLAVSLGLFCLVFTGRGVFSAQVNSLGAMIETDVNFKEVFLQFQQEISMKGSIWNALDNFFLSSFTGENNQTGLPDAVIEQQETAPIQLVLLSETRQHGLAYLREHGLRRHQKEPVADSESPEPDSIEGQPEVVTAVAQTYHASGERLPSNVSYERYELGLNHTIVPVNGTITSTFDYRISPITGKREFHLALDIAAGEGSPIRAFADGTVRYIGESNEFGLYFMIDHDNGVASFYAHCSKLMVRKGDVVTCGDVVALVGQTGNATGPHLHFTIEKDNIRLNPAYYVDPS